MFDARLPSLDLAAQYTALDQIQDQDVAATLRKSILDSHDFHTLISPAAAHYLEPMAQRAQQLTHQRFGKAMQLFIPMYLSNLCYNKCTYCGFSVEHKYPRVILSDKEILAEGQLLAKKGFQHLLLLTGEAEDKVGVDYIVHAIGLLRPMFASIGIEVQPLSEADYRKVIAAGADGLTLYQETYHPESYQKHHLAGKKKHFSKRLQALEHGAKAGFHKINIGALLGLYAWRYEALALSAHLDYMKKKYWQSQYMISFPRIQEMFGEYNPAYDVRDQDLVQLICAFRLCFPDLGISLSTRECATLRDNLVGLGITQMSAESNTAPGGYSGMDSESQFDIADHRPLPLIQDMLKRKGYDPVVKNWDAVLT